MKLKKWIMCFIICIASSYFLTSIINRTTITTKLQFAAVFLYFIIICSIGCWCFFKYIYNKSKCKLKKLVIVSLIISMLLVIGLSDSLIDHFQPTTVTLIPQTNDTVFREDKSIWISNIFIDDKSINLSSIPLSSGWVYNSDWDDIISSVANPKPLSISFSRAQSIKIRFVYYNEFSKTTTIKDGEKICPLTLSADNENGFIYEVNSNHVKFAEGFKTYYIYILCAWLFFSAIIFFLINFGKKYSYGNIFTYILLYILIYFKFDNIAADRSIRIFMLISTLICGKYFSEILGSSLMTKYFKKSGIIWISLVNLYSTFAIYGHSLFLQGDLVEIGLINLARFMICYIYFVQFIYIFLYFGEKLAIRFQNQISVNAKTLPSKIQINKFKVILFFIIFTIILVFSLGFYPGNMTSDGVDQWSQALGINPINDAHPFTDTLLIRLCINLWENPFFIVILQILFFALIITNFLSFLYEKGISIKLLITIAVILSLMPNNFMMLTLVSKNVPFALVTWWITYLLIRLYDNPKRFLHQPVNYLQMIISISLLDLLRHNGFVAMYFVIALLIVFTIKEFKKFKFLPLIIVCGILTVTQIMKGPVMNVMGVQKQNVANSGFLLYPIGSALKNSIDIPYDILEVAEGIAPIEQWESTYNKYNSDPFYFSSPNPDFSGVKTKDAFKIYLRLLCLHPDIVIKDRLDHADLIWDVKQPYDGKNFRYAIGIWPPASLTSNELPALLKAENNHEGVYYSRNFLTSISTKAVSVSSINELADTIFWRYGIYVIAYFILILFCFYRKHYKVFGASLASVGTLFTYILLMGWPIYQYLWFFPISVMMLILYEGVNLSYNVCNPPKMD